MQIRTLIVMVILSCGISTPIKVFCANRAPTPNSCWSLLDWCCGSADHEYVEPSPQIDMTAAVNSKKTNIRSIHQKLSALIEENPNALGELYLRCQGLNFTRFYRLSPHVEEYLMVRELVDHKGQIKNPEIILNFLLFDKDTLDAADWYFHLQVKDLKMHHPEIIGQLLKSAIQPIPSTTLDLLFVQYYKLAASANITTGEEIHAILTECDQPDRGPFRLKALEDYAEYSASSVVIKK